jgi:hypothetical protein
MAKLYDVVSIVAIEPIDSAEPHKAGAVLQDRVDSLVGQPLLDSDVSEFGVLCREIWENYRILATLPIGGR